jgi:autotransporter adhesin
MFIFKVRLFVRSTLLLSSCVPSISMAQTVVPIQNGTRTPLTICDSRFCFIEETPSTNTFALPGTRLPAFATIVGPNAYVGADQGTAVGFQAVVTGVNSVAVGAGSTDNGLSNVFSVGNFGAERQIVYVAPGTVAPGSTNAVNGGQLFAVQQSANQALATANSANSTAAQALSTANSVNATAAQALTTASSASSAAAQALSTANSANATAAQALTAANAASLTLADLSRNANAGVATAIASANIPQAYGPGRTAIGGAVGAWRGQASVAVGASHNFNRFTVRGSFNVDSRGSTGGGAGLGVQF